MTTAVGTGLNSASALPVTFSEVIGDGTWGGKDVDLFRFTASAGDRLTAVTALPTDGQAMDTYLRLFDASGVELAANDDAGTDGLYSAIDYGFATAGTYYIGVSSYPNITYDPNVAGSGIDKDTTTGDYH